MEKLVSVPIVTYNSSAFIEETLESVFNQTYPNIELIISDDCSKDNTVEIIQKWCSQDRVIKRFKDIKILTVPKNTGISANYNRTFKQVTGDWVKFCSGDDALMENCLSDNIDYVTKNPDIKVLFSYCRMYLDEFREECFIKRNPQNYPSGIINDKISVNDQYKLLLLKNRIPFTPSAFINTEVHKRFGIIDEKHGFTEDYQLWLSFTKNNIKLHFFEKETMLYRVHDESVSKQKTNFVINPIYFKTEKCVKELTYEHLPWDIRMSKTFSWYINHLFKIGFFNRKTKLNIQLHYFLNNIVNPFQYIIFIKSNYISKYKKDLFYNI